MQDLFTIDEWCHKRRLSRRTFYNLVRAGKAPETLKLGSAVRITEDADREWCIARQAESRALAERGSEQEAA